MKKTALSLSMLAVLLLVAPAFADTLNLTLANPTQTGTPGATLTFDASASAPFSNSGTLFFNGDNFNVSLAGATIDDTGFFLNFPPAIAPGEGVAATLFTVSLPAAFAPGTYNGFFEILGGSDPNAQDTLATVNFQITTATPVPEPGTWLLFATGLTALAVLVCTRRKTAASAFIARQKS